MNIVSRLFERAGKILILLTLSILFSISHLDVKNALKYLFRRREKGAKKVDETYEGIAHWLKAQMLLCFVIGLATYLGLWIVSRFGIDLPQKGTLALMACMFEVFPYIGPWMGAIPAAISALSLFGFKGLIIIVILYIIIQQSEDKFFVPLVMNKALGVSPVLVFSCMLFGGVTMGFFGILLAVPIAVICTIVFRIPKIPQKKKEKAE